MKMNKLLLCHNMDEFHGRNIDQIHTVRHYTYEVQKQAKLIDGDRVQNSVYIGEDIDWKGSTLEPSETVEIIGILMEWLIMCICTYVKLIECIIKTLHFIV